MEEDVVSYLRVAGTGFYELMLQDIDLEVGRMRYQRGILRERMQTAVCSQDVRELREDIRDIDTEIRRLKLMRRLIKRYRRAA